ncbi:MmgE/PrpD family protein [Aurantimonas marianensis]|uniref:MmgE/PrpD family protein n=1 Tax=Aurantimonas marianensis TaxID=2920428 RepID=A0A9X2HB82_9HYPH|nr:MmgE/PrpD family protein [Aurantimonas marianensis]MCP3054424.1 MmgE/PrpD family protein [Aurantimonas marianensis]
MTVMEAMTADDDDLTGLTTACVNFVQRLRFADLPDEAVRLSKRCLIDGCGVMLAGSEQPIMTPLGRFIASQGGPGQSRLLGDASVRVPAPRAALWHGTAGHAMDWDDTQLAEGPGRPYGLLMHPTVPPLATALSVSDLVREETGEPVDGRRFLTAFNAGFEVACKIAEAINPDHYMKGFHTSGTIGTFAAVVTAGKLLELDAVRLAQAIGIAASMASGVRAGFGTMTKPLHVGRAAENGVTAALLAREGFTGNEEALDGKWGYLAVAGRGGDASLVRDRLGKPFSMVDPGLSIKPYPSGVLTHPSMDAMLVLLSENDIAAEDVEAVTLHAGQNVLGPIRYRIARSELEGKFSFAFLLSAIILRRAAGKAEFTDEFVLSAECQAMQERIETRFDQAIEDMGWDRIRSRVELFTKDGRRFNRWANEAYRGSPHNPLSDEEVRGKFRNCAEGLLDENRVERFFECVETLPHCADAGILLHTLSWQLRDKRP